jgi:hypothetical protein
MKALSIRQPWADLIIEGKKTLELRSWRTHYRGPLAIHASQTVDDAACRAHGVDPRSLSTGVIIGVIDLVDIIALDETSYLERQAEHLGDAPFEPPLFGWALANPQPLAHPVPLPGRMGLFNIPEIWQTASAPPVQAVDHPHERLSLDSRRPFELQVKPEPGTHPSLASYRLALFQRSSLPSNNQPSLLTHKPEHAYMVCELGGTALKSIADSVLESLRVNGYAATDLGVRRTEPFQLSEESGVRLALIFLAVRPVSKPARIEDISRGIRAMTAEELYYWFAKCTAAASAERAQKALRTLLAEE